MDTEVLKATQLRTITVDVSPNEQIIIDELTIEDYRDTLFSLVRQYGNDMTLTHMSNKLITPEVSEILIRQQFNYIKSWTIHDGNGGVMELTYANYVALPERIGTIVSNVIDGFSLEE